MIEKYNFHWNDGFFYNFPKRRAIFEALSKEIASKQIISLVGLRRTGKTTLLKQLIDEIIKSKKAKREHILFYSFDEEQPRIGEIIKDYEVRLGKDIIKLDSRVYIFLDEIQKLDNWEKQIKYFYDSFSNIKFFISGSSSLFIRKKTQESLAGRIYEFNLDVLSFEEFLVFRDKEELIQKKKLLQEAVKKEFLLYQKRQFIETVSESEEKVAQYVKTIIEKIVFQDIPRIFPIEHEELLLRILKIISSNPGMLSDYQSLSNELGISRVTLSNYFFYLEESFLIRKLYNFSDNMLTSEKKMKKFYLISTAFFSFLNSSIDEPKLVENLLVNSTHARFFWRTPQKYEVDIILQKDGKIIPIEVKYQENISKKELKNLIRFCEAFKVGRAIIITKSQIGEKTENNVKVKLIPAWLFLLEEE